MHQSAVVATLKAHVCGNTERRHSQLLRRKQALTVGPAGMVKLAKDLLEADMPHVTVTTTVAAFVRSVLDAPKYHARHLTLLNRAPRPKTLNDLIRLAEDIEKHKPQDQRRVSV
jgi:hypothetical protein